MTAVFVLSTGRCGTRWLARFFELNLGAAATVTHEPIHDDYSPRQMLGAKNPSNLDAVLREPIEEHVQSIRDVLATRTYIECGHPAWSSIPYLVDTFKPDVRVIHIVRHPVPTAWSWMTHRAFCEPILPHIAERVLLSPFDAGVRFPEYRERWSRMSPFEKSLYYWLEVNAFGKSARSELGVPWLTLSFDELFSLDAQQRLMKFVGPAREELESPAVVDDARFTCEIPVDPREIGNHLEVLQLAADFGFDPLRYELPALQKRYLRPLPASRS